MLGLRRNTVRHESYTTEWEKEFLKIKMQIDSALESNSIKVEHIGSTAIKGMLSKPILDIGIGVSSKKEIAKVVRELEKIGFIDRGDRADRGGYLMVKVVAPEVVSHHIHILITGDEQWNNYLYFRDQLRADGDLIKEYEKVKEDLLNKHLGDRAKYTIGKEAFIKKVLGK